MGKRRRCSDTHPEYDRVPTYETGPDGESDSSSYKRTTTQKKHKQRHKADGAARVSQRKVDSKRGASLHSRSSHDIQSSGSIQNALLQWYGAVHEARGMPWRKPYNPSLGQEERAQRAYEVWISEIMLQQTQVATVIPYYNRWMQKFPTIRDLAASTIDEVNALWKGLGYYTRASRLLAGAQKTVTQYEGRLPNNAKDMEANIPGIGRYSAGAICSIAYGERVPVLDGNVHRLLSRFLALYAPPKRKATLDILWAAATTLVHLESNQHSHVVRAYDHIRNLARPSLPGIESLDVEKDPMDITSYPGDINQALIELGSTICKVREPDCDSCPLRPWCRAYTVAFGDSELNNQKSPVVHDIEDACMVCEPLREDDGVTAYPMKAERKKIREELDIVNVVEWSSNLDPSDRWFLLVRRPKGGLLAGLYEFPTSTNVSKALTRTMVEIPNTLLSQFLLCTVLPYKPGTRKRPAQTEAALRIKAITPVGDIVHAFSHVRKTYRVQWVTLEGGESLPKLKLGTTGLLEKPTKASVEEQIDVDDIGEPASALPMYTMWIRLKDVSDAKHVSFLCYVFRAS